MRSLESLAVADLAPLPRNRFRISPGDSPTFEVELGELTEIPREPGGRVPFSLVLEGGPNPPLPQSIYRAEHEELGAIEIFLVPIASDRYEAAFT